MTKGIRQTGSQETCQGHMGTSTPREQGQLTLISTE